MEVKIGIDMKLPDDKQAVDYAQIANELAGRIDLFDRHHELLVLDVPEQLAPAMELLAHYKVEGFTCELLLLPEDGVEPGDAFGDYAIITKSGHKYLDLATAALFKITAGPEADTAPALLQLREHTVAAVRAADGEWFAIDRSLRELAERVARAYGCGVVLQPAYG